MLIASEDQSGKVNGVVKEKAAEVLQLVQRRVPPLMFAGAYQRVKERQKVARRERKKKAAMEAVADPERAAQKRIATNLGKRKAKARKMDRMKRTRDVSGGSLGVGKKRRRA